MTELMDSVQARLSALDEALHALEHNQNVSDAARAILHALAGTLRARTDELRTVYVALVCGHYQHIDLLREQVEEEMDYNCQPRRHKLLLRCPLCEAVARLVDIYRCGDITRAIAWCEICNLAQRWQV